MKKPCSEMFCLRNQDITDAKAFFYLFFMSNSGYLECGKRQSKIKPFILGYVLSVLTSKPIKGISLTQIIFSALLF